MSKENKKSYNVLKGEDLVKSAYLRKENFKKTANLRRKKVIQATEVESYNRKKDKFSIKRTVVGTAKAVGEFVLIAFGAFVVGNIFTNGQLSEYVFSQIAPANQENFNTPANIDGQGLSGLSFTEPFTNACKKSVKTEYSKDVNGDVTVKTVLPAKGCKVNDGLRYR